MNLAGLDFGGQYPPTPTVSELDYWYALGCRHIRLPVNWNHLQPALNAPLDSAQVAIVRTLVDGCISRGMKCLIDLHNFGTWGGFSLNSAQVPIGAFADFWGRMSLAFAYADGSLIAYDLMNEPVNTAGGEAGWVAAAKAAITAIRANDATKVIYVEGSNWASSWDFVSRNPTLHSVRDVDPANKIIISAHCYLDHANEGAYFNYDVEAATPGSAPAGINTNPNILIQRTSAFIQWGIDHGYNLHIGELGCPADPNNPRTTNDAAWQTALRNGLNALRTAGVEVDMWAAGPAWGNYPQSLEPFNGRQSRTVVTLQEYWNTENVQPAGYFSDGPTRGSPGVASGNFTIDYRGRVTGSVVVTPAAVSGGTWSPANRTLTGDNPTGTFTLTMAGEALASVTFTNNGGLTNPPALTYSTLVDDFITVSDRLQNLFSLERKVATYNGPCLRLARSSDNAESDFNFASSAMYAYLDTAAIATWAGASTLYFVQGYNQSFATNPNHLVPPYTDSTAGAATPADRPQFVLDDGDGYPAIIFSNNRMDWESPLEGVTGQVIITNVNAIGGSPLMNWSFIQMECTWGCGYHFGPGDGTTNIYGNTSERLTLPTGMEVNEWHVYAGTWRGGPATGVVKTWRDGELMGIGDSGAASLTVDYHRNQLNVGYRRFGNERGSFHLRDLIVLNGVVPDSLVNTIQARMVTKYNTTRYRTLPAPDIVLDIAANTYTVDGAASSLAANIANSPTRDANGLICDGTQTYAATGPLLAALQTASFTVQVETKNITEGQPGGWALMRYVDAAGTSFQRQGWLNFGGVLGNIMQTQLANGTFIETWPGGDGHYVESFGAGYRGNLHKHNLAKFPTGFAYVADESGDGPLVALPQWSAVSIGHWPDVPGHQLVGRISKISVWRNKRLSVRQQIMAAENIRTKGAVPAPFLMGINCAGLEYGSPGIPGRFEAIPTAAQSIYWASMGMTLMRVPFSWMRMQQTLNGPLDTTDLNYLKVLVAANKARGITSLLDLHNMSVYIPGPPYTTAYGLDAGDGHVTTAHFVDFWSRMSQVAEFNDPLVWFGLMNEPGEFVSQATWFTSCAAATAAIRAHNVVSQIAVPHLKEATKARYWSTYAGDAFLANYSDSANKSIIEVHQYFDADGAGDSPDAGQGTAHYALCNMIRWCRDHGKKFMVGETGWATDSSAQQGQIEGDELLRMMRNADDVCVGFTYWSAGPSVGNYFQTCEPETVDFNYSIPRGDRTQVGAMRKWIPNPY